MSIQIFGYGVIINKAELLRCLEIADTDIDECFSVMIDESDLICFENKDENTYFITDSYVELNGRKNISIPNNVPYEDHIDLENFINDVLQDFDDITPNNCIYNATNRLCEDIDEDYNHQELLSFLTTNVKSLNKSEEINDLNVILSEFNIFGTSSTELSPGPMQKLNVREKDDITNDPVSVDSLRVQDRSAVFSASGGKDSLIKPTTSGQLSSYIKDSKPIVLSDDEYLSDETFSEEECSSEGGFSSEEDIIEQPLKD